MTEVYTSRYQSFRPDQGVPVRTSQGAPRWPLGYALQEKLPELAPTTAIRKHKQLATYRPAYVAMLEGHGPELIWRLIQRISARNEDRPVVLLCFCDLNVAPPENWCHRRIFAEWFEASTGMVVPELTPAPTRPARSGPVVLACDVDPDEEPGMLF